MGKCKDFLELYQLCQSAKRCGGQDFRSVSDMAMEKAQEVDEKASVRPQNCHTEAHDCYGCIDCQNLSMAVSGLLSHLEGCGVSLPAAVIAELQGMTNRT